MQRLRAGFGLPERPIQEMIDEYLGLTPFPPKLTTVGSPVAPTTHYVRALPADGTDALPTWIDQSGVRPFVYASLGTIWRVWRGLETFSTVLEGLRGIDTEIVLTIGRDVDPSSLGPQPASIHVEQFLPLRALLAHCSLVLFHGGSGTLGHVAAEGLPMVILPFGADQPENAVRCAELGVSRSLDPEELAPDAIRDVVLDVLKTPSYRQCAELLRDEFNALPGPELAVELLERLARDKVPIINSR